MKRLALTALAVAGLSWSGSGAQAAAIDSSVKPAPSSQPLSKFLQPDTSFNGKAERRRGHRGHWGGYRSGLCGANRGYRGGGRNFGARGHRNYNRGSRHGYRAYRGHGAYGVPLYRGRSHVRGGFIGGSVFLGGSFGYPSYGYPAYGYPVYGFHNGYQRCRYRGRYYDASFCYSFPYGYRHEYLPGYGPAGVRYRHYHGHHCEHDRRHHGYYRDW